MSKSGVSNSNANRSHASYRNKPHRGNEKRIKQTLDEDIRHTSNTYCYSGRKITAHPHQKSLLAALPQVPKATGNGGNTCQPDRAWPLQRDSHCLSTWQLSCNARLKAQCCQILRLFSRWERGFIYSQNIPVHKHYGQHSVPSKACGQLSYNPCFFSFLEFCQHGKEHIEMLFPFYSLRGKKALCELYTWESRMECMPLLAWASNCTHLSGLLYIC